VAETIATALRDARFALAARGVATPALDARLLLQATTGLTHDAIIADGDQILDASVRAHFKQLLQRRLAHEPVSRILGYREFYGRRFVVTPDVLDPRSDTEALIELCAELRPTHILDVGVGSGAILLTLLCEHAQAKGVGVDLSTAAINVAQQNAVALELSERCQFIRSDWFENLHDRFDLIVSNPPYIASTDIAALAPDVQFHDPRLALDGGGDGLAAYRVLARECSAHLAPAGHVAVEIGAGQKSDVVGLFAAQGYRLKQAQNDIAGHVRALLFVHN
jgi:release factor glutamine methyltransferase